MENTSEIDLMELFRNLMVKTYHFSIRWYKLFALFILTGAIIGVYMYLKDKNTFEKTLIAESDLIKSEYLIHMINSLDDISKNKVTLSKVLGISQEESENLLKISADTLESKSSIQIKLRFKKDVILADFSKKLINYIDSNPYVKREYLLEKKRCTEMIAKYNQEIEKMDSLQSKTLPVKRNTAFEANNNLLVLNDKVYNLYVRDIVELEDERQNELKRLNRLASLLIIDDKSTTMVKEVPLIPSIIKWILIFIGLAFLISIVFELKRSVELVERESKI